MKRTNTLLFLLILTTLLTTTCKKKVHKEADLWVGKWEGNSFGCAVFLDVDDRSKGHWIRTGLTGCNADVNGRVKIKGDVLKLGAYNFDIIQHPTPVDPSDSIYVNGVLIDASYSAEIDCRSIHCENGPIHIWR